MSTADQKKSAHGRQSPSCGGAGWRNRHCRPRRQVEPLHMETRHTPLVGRTKCRQVASRQGSFSGNQPAFSRSGQLTPIAIRDRHREIQDPRTRARVRFVGLSRPARLGVPPRSLTCRTWDVNNPERRLAGEACRWLPSARKMILITRQPVNPLASVKPRVREFWAQAWGTGALASGVPATTGRHRRDEESLTGWKNDANSCRKAG